VGRGVQEDPGDEEILEWAHREGRVLVTLDKDFGELAIIHERSHCGIIAWLILPPDNKPPFV